MNILYLSLNPNLQGPFPKIDPLLIAGMRKAGYQVTKLPWGRHSEHETLAQKIFGRLGDIVRVLQALLQERYDILYVVTTLNEYALARDMPLLLATYWLPVKKVLILHGSKTDPLADPSHLLYKLSTRLLLLLSDAIFLLSSEELEIFKKLHPRGNYYRVDNPFISGRNVNLDELTRKIQKTNSKPTLLFAGRLIREKGVIDLLHAMPSILKHIECHLVIAGEGEEKEETEALIEKSGLKQQVSLLGYVATNELAGFYESSSIFILPTYFGEGFPTVLAEAMSFGLPLITTPIRGASDHLQDGVHALFVQPRDSDAIAETVVRLLMDPELCLKMGCANLEKIQEFMPERVVPGYIQIFSEIAG